MGKVLRFDADGNAVWVDKVQARHMAKTDVIVSDGLGCTLHTVEEARADAKLHGFNVDFKPDPTMIEDGQALFYQAHVPKSQWERYYKHVNPGWVDKTGSSGAAMSPAQLSEAEEQVKRRFGRGRQG